MKLKHYFFAIALLSTSSCVQAIRTQTTHPLYQPIADFKASHTTAVITSRKASQCQVSGAVRAESIVYENGDRFCQCQWPHKGGTDFYLFVAGTASHTKAFVPYTHQR